MACPASASREASVGLVPQRLPRPGDLGVDDRWTRGIGELGRGIVHSSLWSVALCELSDGNQRRVQLAIALASLPALLCVDEPTNYLDLDTIEALEESLRQ